MARLVAYRRLTLPKLVSEWVHEALRYSYVKLIELSPEIAVDSTQLPEPFHKDPCDRIIVATARRLDVSLATTDGLIRRYQPNVKVV